MCLLCACESLVSCVICLLHVLTHTHFFFLYTHTHSNTTHYTTAQARLDALKRDSLKNKQKSATPEPEKKVLDEPSEAQNDIASYRQAITQQSLEVVCVYVHIYIYIYMCVCVCVSVFVAQTGHTTCSLTHPHTHTHTHKHSHTSHVAHTHALKHSNYPPTLPTLTRTHSLPTPTQPTTHTNALTHPHYPHSHYPHSHTTHTAHTAHTHALEHSNTQTLTLPTLRSAPTRWRLSARSSRKQTWTTSRGLTRMSSSQPSDRVCVYVCLYEYGMCVHVSV
jgi:hypothetical protein